MSSIKTTAHQTRQAFLDYFSKQGHAIVPSAPLVPPNDPTLMFTNAGMVQFKDCFTGRETRSYSRAASSQKCIRISGKHNDLENVGRTARHHTFFEMLGNFSFGNYFKADAIAFAWELITKVYGISKDNLIVTVFKGEEGVPADDEARVLWKKITGFGDDRIVGMGKSDNFWSMGDTGPCGPCTEIHYYHSNKKGPVNISTFGQEPLADGTGWMEIWNLVFMQFERFADGRLIPLPAQSVDTGMGLERIASVVQGVTSNYDTDLLRALVEKAASISGKIYKASDSEDDVSMRVIADHARTTAFLISEGIFPNRDDREYVLRRVMRRAIRHGHRLGIEKPFLHDVANEVVALMGEAYPQLYERRKTILSVTEEEEIRFRRTLIHGLKILDEQLETLKVKHSQKLSGDEAFKLADTYGFPLDLTRVICEERGFDVDENGFKIALEKAQALSAGSKVGSAAIDDVYHSMAMLLEHQPTQFLGYETEAATSTIAAIVHNGKIVQSIQSGTEAQIVTLQTPFYGESGGQVGDQGEIRSASGAKFIVTDTQKPIGNLIVHSGKLESGSLRVDVNEEIELEVNHETRSATRRNHSATHLLHFALRHVLGEHVQQKGSLVAPHRLRFDYTHSKPMTSEELQNVEDIVNEMILENVEVKTELMRIADARALGAMAIFEEKYGDTVRVLTMKGSRYTSIELCGGTHASRTGDIGLFRILSDKPLASGVRRIEASTGLNSLQEIRTFEQAMIPVLKTLGVDAMGAAAKIEKILADEKALQKKIVELEKKVTLGGTGTNSGIDAWLSQAQTFGTVKALAVQANLSDAAAQRELADTLRDKLGDAIVLVASVQSSKVQLVLTVSKSLTAKFKANELIRPVAALIGGSGGGRPDMAQAGGTLLEKCEQIPAELYRQVEHIVG